MRSILLPILSFFVLSANAQLLIDNATFFIGEGAVVTVQGNLTTNKDIETGGSGNTRGKILMKGSALQTITTSGATTPKIPRLEIDNASHVNLAGHLQVQNLLELTTGRLQILNHNLILPVDMSITGQGAAKFIETNGTGEVQQLVPANLVIPKELPIGTGANYTPATVNVTGASGMSATSYVGVRATGVAVPTPQRHPRTETYLATAWNVNRSGITGGTINVSGKYVDGQISGLTEPDIRGMYWNGTTWSMVGGTQDAATNTVAANATANSGVVYGMNRFLLVNPKVFLQGAYNSGTGLMNETLRTPTNVIPLSDPYRSAPYSGQFSHTANMSVETIEGAVLNNQANPENNIVDWVFVELRNISSPTVAPVTQTRSVLIQRDGDLVDVDGVSPVYFKNIDAGNFAVSVRHRNHLGISSNPATPIALGLTSTSYNFTTAAGSGIFGTAGTNYLNQNSVNQMYAGDVNRSFNTNYIAFTTTDRASIITVLANPGNAPQPSRTITNAAEYLQFGAADVNMDRSVNYISFGVSDRSFILSSVLGGIPNAPSKTQALPN